MSNFNLFPRGPLLGPSSYYKALEADNLKLNKDLDMNNQKIINLADSQNSKDAVNKNYIDSLGIITSDNTPKTDQTLAYWKNGKIISSSILISEVTPTDNTVKVDNTIPFWDNNQIKGSSILISDIVKGPANSTDNEIVRFDSTTGKLIQSSGVTIDDAKSMQGLTSLSLSGTTSGKTYLEAGNVVVDYTLTLPSSQGSNKSVLQNNGSGQLSWVVQGDVTGPTSSTNNAIARFDLTTGKIIKNSSIFLGDSRQLSNVGSVSIDTTGGGNNITINSPSVTSTYSITLPGSQGGANTYLKNNGSGTLTWSLPGDVVGPDGATDNTIPRFDQSTGKMLQTSSVSINDSNVVSGVTELQLKSNLGSVGVKPAVSSGTYTLTLPANFAPTSGTSVLLNQGNGELTWSEPGLQKITVFSSNTTFTPLSNTSFFKVYVTGGGGGGGGGLPTGANQLSVGSGGNSGATVVGLFKHTLGSTGTVIIGGGGSGGTVNGSPGGNSQFLYRGSLLQANGGLGGIGPVAATNGFNLSPIQSAPGSNTGINSVLRSTFYLEGQHGGCGIAMNGLYGLSGYGAPSFWASGGHPKTYNNGTQSTWDPFADNTNGGRLGSGGAGYAQGPNVGASFAGAPGGDGICVIYEYC